MNFVVVDRVRRPDLRAPALQRDLVVIGRDLAHEHELPLAVRCRDRSAVLDLEPEHLCVEIEHVVHVMGVQNLVGPLESHRFTPLGHLRRPGTGSV